MSISAVFRKHPELEPTGRLSLLGEVSCTVDQMNAYARRRNPQAPEVAELYSQLGQHYGVRGDVAYCQMIYETKGWTALTTGPSWAPFTLNQWSEEPFIELQMQILYTFANPLDLPRPLPAAKQSIAIIERAGWRGRVQCWEDLNGKWSTTGKLYGQDIVAIWRNLKEWTIKAEPILGSLNGSEVQSARDTPRRTISRGMNENEALFSNEEMKWLVEQQLLPHARSAAPHPERQVTWAELAALLRQWEKRSPPATIEKK